MNYHHGDVDGETNRIHEMVELGASGFLIRPACVMRAGSEHRDNSKLFAEIAESNRAVVTVDKILPEYKVSAVVCNYEAIEPEMVKYLTQREVRRIVYIGSGDGYIAGVRYDVMMAAGRSAGLEFTVNPKEIRFRASQGYSPAAYAYDHMRVVDKTPAEAVICYSPQLAMGVLDAIKSSPWIENKRVKYVLTFCCPTDVDRLRRFASGGVEIVTVQVAPAELAKQAAEMLLEHIDNGLPAKPEIRKVVPKLCVLKNERPNAPGDWHEY
jgi:DNA-binding LacI/PurR family transcriptional regulator